MKTGGRANLAAAAQVFAPFLVLIAAAALVASAPGAGIGFVAGLIVALAAVLHALVFGAQAARRAAPPAMLRLALVFGVLAALAGLALQGNDLAHSISEAGLFLATAAGAMLAINTLIGRASALDETSW
jgi:multisubunit Na+/H+ antiporter MnhB subunit